MNVGSPQANSQSSNYRPIIKRLQDNGITHVAIIDDVFDPISKDTLINEIEQFQAEVLADDEAWQELDGFCAKFGAVATDLINAPDELWRFLLEKHDGLTALKRHCEVLFQRVKQDKEWLSLLRQAFETDLQLCVSVHGVDADVDQLAAQIVFLDYFLGIGQRQHEEATLDHISSDRVDLSDPRKRAMNKAKAIHATHPSTLIILMSSREEGQREAERFRDETGLLVGLFHFINKADFAERDKLHFHINLSVTNSKHGAQIQRFVEAVAQTIESASQEFIKDIKKLTLSDYAYAQRINLQKDGHPLGDYLIWLFSSYLGHLVFERQDVLDAERELVDKIVFSAAIPPQFPPNKQLLELYRYAVWNTNVPDVTTHPRQAEEKVEDIPYLNSGDLFVKDSTSKVALLITPGCDLAFTPEDAGSRVADLSRSLIFLPGELVELYKRPGNEQLRTDFFELNGKLYQIWWEPKKLITIRWGRFWRWKKKTKCKRIACLRLPYVVEIQQEVAASFGRVGVPVAPPVIQPASVQLVWGEKDQPPVELTSVQPNAALIVTGRDGKRHCSLTPEFLFNLSRLLPIKLQPLEQSQNGPMVNGESRGVSLEAKLRSLLEIFSLKQQLAMLESFELKGGEKPHLIAEKIAVWKQVAANNKYPFDVPYALKIIEE